MQAHINSGVVMDIAAFKVSHSTEFDMDATALRDARARSSSIGAMEEMSGNVQNAALTCCDAEIKSTRATAGQFKGQFKGAMERYTWVRFAGKLTTCQTTHIAMISISVGRWRTCQGRFKKQTLTYCNAKITSMRTAVSQFKGQFNNGAMEEMSRQGQKASVHDSLR